MKKDITCNEDIRRLVDSFYEKICKDDLLAVIFTDIMAVDWKHHLPRMYLFWEKILFSTGDYDGRPFPPHMAVNEKATLTTEHFVRWLQIFNSTTDELFEGAKAEEIKWRASTISMNWEHKFRYINGGN